MPLNPKIQVRGSSIHGRGLYAREPFEKGETFSVVTEADSDSVVMTDSQFQAYVGTVDAWNAVYLGHGRHRVRTLPPEDDPSYCGNHSCAPNTAPHDDGLVALADIAAGEELTVDYAQFSPSSWEMTCACGAAACRRIVRGSVRT